MKYTKEERIDIGRQVYTREISEAEAQIKYDIANSKLNREGVKAETCACEEAPAPIMADGTYLFTTATCPNCKIACSLLDKAGISYEKLLANEYANEVNAFGIKQAPTLVVIKNGVAEKFAGVSDIKKAFNL